MRRKDRARNEPEFFGKVLGRAETMFLALFDGEYPYCLPVNFAVSGSRIYIHSALAGHKLELIAANPHVAFSAATDIKIDTANSTTYYKSVCGRGIAVVVQDQAEKARALDLIGERYDALCQRPAPAAATRRVAIIRIEITEMTGKECKPGEGE